MTNTNSSENIVLAPTSRRISAYMIDVSMFWAINLFTIIPVLGAMIDFALLFYMLLRDASGASIGKRVFGLTIADKSSGSPASTWQCIGRNIFFAAPLLVEWVPCLGFFIGSGFLISVCLVELVMILTNGRRIGDLLAGTEVLKG